MCSQSQRCGGRRGEERREVEGVAGEGVEETDGIVGAAGALLLLEQEEDAVDGVEDDVVAEKREPLVGAGSRGAVHEASRGRRRRLAGTGAGGGKHDPVARVEARVEDAAAAGGGGAGAPVGAGGAEADVVEEVAGGQHAPADEVDQICLQRHPRGRVGVAGGGTRRGISADGRGSALATRRRRRRRRHGSVLN